jgi:hypothetical protein
MEVEVILRQESFLRTGITYESTYEESLPCLMLEFLLFLKRHALASTPALAII